MNRNNIKPPIAGRERIFSRGKLVLYVDDEYAASVDIDEGKHSLFLCFEPEPEVDPDKTLDDLWADSVFYPAGWTPPKTFTRKP